MRVRRRDKAWWFIISGKKSVCKKRYVVRCCVVLANSAVTLVHATNWWVFVVVCACLLAEHGQACCWNSLVSKSEPRTADVVWKFGQGILDSKQRTDMEYGVEDNWTAYIGQRPRPFVPNPLENKTKQNLVHFSKKARACLDPQSTERQKPPMDSSSYCPSPLVVETRRAIIARVLTVGNAAGDEFPGADKQKLFLDFYLLHNVAPLCELDGALDVMGQWLARVVATYGSSSVELSRSAARFAVKLYGMELNGVTALCVLASLMEHHPDDLDLGRVAAKWGRTCTKQTPALVAFAKTRLFPLLFKHTSEGGDNKVALDILYGLVRMCGDESNHVWFMVAVGTFLRHLCGQADTDQQVVAACMKLCSQATEKFPDSYAAWLVHDMMPLFASLAERHQDNAAVVLSFADCLFLVSQVVDSIKDPECVKSILTSADQLMQYMPLLLGVLRQEHASLGVDVVAGFAGFLYMFAQWDTVGVDALTELSQAVLLALHRIEGKNPEDAADAANARAFVYAAVSRPGVCSHMWYLKESASFIRLHLERRLAGDKEWEVCMCAEFFCNLSASMSSNALVADEVKQAECGMTAALEKYGATNEEFPSACAKYFANVLAAVPVPTAAMAVTLEL
jgi:hypothetical protein